jgi:hypothetical protein
LDDFGPDRIDGGMFCDGRLGGGGGGSDSHTGGQEPRCHERRGGRDCGAPTNAAALLPWMKA